MAASVLILALTWAFLRILLSLTGLLSARFSRYRLQINRFFPVARLFLWTSAIYVVVVYVFRPQTNALLALAASFGIALGLALQDSVRNVLSGLFILFDQPFRIGDMIQVGAHYGEVRGIGLRSVRIHTFDDSIVTIPNSTVAGEAVSNSNSGELNEMVVVDIDLPATIDPSRVRQLAWEAAASSPFVYLKKPIVVGVEDRFDRVFLTRFKIRSYVSDIRLERVLASDITQRLKGELIGLGLLTPAMVSPSSPPPAIADRDRRKRGSP